MWVWVRLNGLTAIAVECLVDTNGSTRRGGVGYMAVAGASEASATSVDGEADRGRLAMAKVLTPIGSGNPATSQLFSSRSRARQSALINAGVSRSWRDSAAGGVTTLSGGRRGRPIIAAARRTAATAGKSTVFQNPDRWTDQPERVRAVTSCRRV